MPFRALPLKGILDELPKHALILPMRPVQLLNDPTLPEHADLVRQSPRLAKAVGDGQNGVTLLKLCQKLLYPLRGPEVEGCRGLIQEENPRLQRQNPRKAKALLLTS